MRPLRSLGFLVVMAAGSGLTGLVACGSSSDSSDSPLLNGTAGAGGGASGKGGASTGGTSSGGTASGGKGGSAGATGGTGATAGTSSGGKGGTSAGGSAGKGGSAGSATCKVDADCTAAVPTTTPPNCAVAKCDTKSSACIFSAKDIDGDGHATNKCAANDGTPVVLGDDCNDGDKLIYPGAWDGPKGDGHPDSCDSVDEDCNGLIDDTKLKDGTSCTCLPGDVKQCSEDSGGKPITWPTGKPAGACKYGSQTCLANGSYGPCTGAVGPSQEVCNHLDDDCNGTIDDGPPPDNVPVDAVYFAYDGDNDQHGLMVGNGYNLVHACSFNTPKTAPISCTSGSFANCTLGKTAAECCPPGAWKFAAALQSDDCNDENPNVNPLAPELCDTIDNNCDGKIDTACVCTPNKVENCSATPNGNPIVFPGGSPQGACSYGARTCSADGKSWGPCNGAISPAGSDDCITAGGVDTNCDGKISCTCSPLGDVKACANQKGSCAGATQTCGASGYGTCTIVPQAVDTCDAGNDDSCNGTPNEGCANINGTPCGDATTCNVGIWTNCDATGSCVCSGGPPVAPAVWCYDGDSDFYCDLSKTQSVCANAPTQPATPWRPLSTAACTDVATCTDCNDANATIHPNAFEACNGVDSNCNMTVNDGCGCQNGTTKSCGSAAQCNQGAIQTCNNGAYGACSIPAVLNAGTNCGGSGLGACSAIDSAQWVCTGPSTGAANCKYISTVSVGATFHTAAYPTNSSYDWNCDGVNTIEYPNADIDFVYPFGCNNTGTFDYWCSQIPPGLNGNPCYNTPRYIQCVPNGIPCVNTDTCSSSCGSSMKQVFCKYDSVNHVCAYDATKAIVPLTQACELCFGIDGRTSRAPIEVGQLMTAAIQVPPTTAPCVDVR